MFYVRMTWDSPQSYTVISAANLTFPISYKANHNVFQGLRELDWVSNCRGPQTEVHPFLLEADLQAEANQTTSRDKSGSSRRKRPQCVGSALCLYSSHRWKRGGNRNSNWALTMCQLLSHPENQLSWFHFMNKETEFQGSVCLVYNRHLAVCFLNMFYAGSKEVTALELITKINSWMLCECHLSSPFPIATRKHESKNQLFYSFAGLRGSA